MLFSANRHQVVGLTWALLASAVWDQVSSYPELIKKHLGLHSTDYLTPYFSLWARIENFDPAQLFDDLNQKQAFRIWAFRGTLFVVHQENLKIVLGAIEYFLAGRRKEALNLAGKIGLNLDAAAQKVTELFEKNFELATGEIKIFEMDPKISANDDIMRLIQRKCDKLAVFVNERLVPLIKKN